MWKDNYFYEFFLNVNVFTNSSYVDQKISAANIYT